MVGRFHYLDSSAGLLVEGGGSREGQRLLAFLHLGVTWDFRGGVLGVPSVYGHYIAQMPEMSY